MAAMDPTGVLVYELPAVTGMKERKQERFGLKVADNFAVTTCSLGPADGGLHCKGNSGHLTQGGWAEGNP